MQPLIEVHRYCHSLIFLNNFVLVTAKPHEVHLKNGVLHREGGEAALVWEGLSQYALNGIKIGEKITVTSAADFDP